MKFKGGSKWAVFLLWLFVCSTSADAQRVDTVPVSHHLVSEQEIDQLVQQLGAKTYRARKRAETRLESMGLLAFEALLDQRDHENIEIRLGSRRLVEKLRLRFLTEGVDPAFETILQNYVLAGADGRERIVQYFSSLLPQQASNELARIARIEEEPRISKLAAVAFMEVPFPEDERQRIEYAEQIESAIGFGSRPAVRWLRLYAAALRGIKYEDRDPAEVWTEMLEAEEQLAEQLQEEGATADILQMMHRLHGDLNDLMGDEESARAARRRVSDRPFGDADEIIAWMNWLLDRRAWPSVVDLAEKRKAEFEANAILLYGLAESHMRLGKEAESKESLEQAFAASPQDDDLKRARVAFHLKENRGLFDWAEKEFRQVLDFAAEESSVRISCFPSMADMFHDQGRSKEAHEAISRWFKEIGESAIVSQVSENQYRDLDVFRARRHLYLANHYRDVGDTTKQCEQLESALQYDATEADVLIEMYRVDDADEEWKNKTLRRIQSAAETFSRNIYDARSAFESGEENRAGLRTDLAGALNQMAWLVSNTEGDYAEAMRMSKNSLQLSPGDAGIMDTLGRCCYSAGDYQSAVKYQRWAHQRSPHGGLILKQLRLFESALEASHEASREAEE